MGGGDLNSKKSWHPNTIKNQERVWKAEQQAAEEKKRIMELQHERAAERDCAELNELAKRTAGASNSDDRLHWMYDKPDKKGQAEDYLLGKTIEKNYDQPEKSDDIIPAVARRVVGSSMMMTAEDSQVDLARKMREDPLLLVKERERAARAALLNNPLHRKRIAELLRKEQEQQKGSKSKSAKKKNKDLDSMLAAKLNALGGEKGVDVAALLASDDSSSGSDSSDDESTKKKKKKKSDKKAKKSKKSMKKKIKESVTSESLDDNKRHIKEIKQQKALQGHTRYETGRSKWQKESTRNRSDKSDSEDNVKSNSEERSHFDSTYKSIKQKNYEHIESRNQRSRSCDYDCRTENKRDIKDGSADRRYVSYWRQDRKHSTTRESEKNLSNKQNKRDHSMERQQNEYRRGRKHRSASTEIKNRTNKYEDSDKSYKDDTDNKRKPRNRGDDSDREAKNKSRMRDSPEYKKYRVDDKEHKRRHRSVSRDSEEEKRNKSSKINKQAIEPSGRRRRVSSGDRKERESLKRKSPEQSDRELRDSSGDRKERENLKRRSPVKRARDEEKLGKSKRGGLSVEEKAARLAEMAAAGAEREVQRARRVAAQRADPAPAPPRPRARLAALPDSLEARIHSNRNYIQRNQTYMNEHFARR